MKQIIIQELREAEEALSKFVSDAKNIEAIENAARVIVQAVQNGRKVLTCGNGGSHCDAMHFAEEFTGRFRKERRALPAVAISDVSHLTCTANDFGFDAVFSRYIEAIGNQGDVLFAISTSGNSRNILRAAEAARGQQMKIIALTGHDGGKLAALADVEVRVGQQGFSDRIQEIHIKIIHILIHLVETEMGLN